MKSPKKNRSSSVSTAEIISAGDLSTILSLVQDKTGYDFHKYKEQTLTRRLLRRLSLRHCDDVKSYIELLREDKNETETLVQDLLICVTGFFRDPQAWAWLEKHVLIPLVADKPAGESLRVWVPGCATGEEAYTVAMLIMEQEQKQGKKHPIRVFATDINMSALALARAALYPQRAGEEMSQQRLERFFSTEGEMLRVSKLLRECMVFAHHNLISDPPFSSLDLVVCRNVMIYLNGELQQQILDQFRFALNPGGCLFLGTSETVSQRDDFETISKKWRIYRNTARPVTLNGVPIRVSMAGRKPKQTAVTAMRERSNPADVMHQLVMRHVAPAAALVNEFGDILYLTGPVDAYLHVPAGKPQTNILALARQGLQISLSMALREASRLEEGVVIKECMVKRGKKLQAVSVSIQPVSADGHENYQYLVVFRDLPQTPLAVDPRAISDDERVYVRQLETELQEVKHEYSGMIEQLESMNEELKAANEEAMSMNEELQSSNEELETSKEELQSLNEELNTLNTRLEEKIQELEDTNNDLEIFLTSTPVATIFVDKSIRIRRFTPPARNLFRLIESDIGRALADISACFDQSSLSRQVKDVLRSLITVREEVMTDNGRWYQQTIIPYRTRDDRILGAVLTFSDITDLKTSQKDLDSISRFPLENPSPVLRVDPNGTVIFANASAGHLLNECDSGFGRSLPDLWNEAVRESFHARKQRTFEVWHKDRAYLFGVVPVEGADYANLYGTDVTELKRTEEALRRSEGRWSAAIEMFNEGAIIANENEQLIYWNPAARKMHGFTSEKEGIGPLKEASEIFELRTPDGSHLLAIEEWPMKRIKRGEFVHNLELRLRRLDQGWEKFVSYSGALLDTAGGERLIFLSVSDLSEQRKAELALRVSKDDLDRAQEVGSIGSWRLNVQRNELTWSDENHRIFGIPKGTLLTYETFLSIVHPDDRDYVDTRWKAGLQGEPYDIEHRLVVDGRIKWVREKAYLEFDEQNVLLGGFGITQDITDRKQTEKTLLQATQRFALLSATASELLQSDQPYELIDSLCRRVMEHLDCQVFFNFLVDEFAGKLHLNACAGVPEEETSRIEWLDYGIAVCGCVARDGDRIVAEYIQETPDERTDLVRSYGVRAYACHPLLNESGRVIGTLSFGSKARDSFSAEDISLMKAVTDQVAVAMIRIRNEEALRSSEQRQKEMIRYAPAAIYEIDLRNRRFLSVNDTMCRMLGYSREELLAMEPSGLLDEESKRLFQERVDTWLKGEKLDENIEFKVKTKDGRELYADLKITFEQDENGNIAHAFVIGHDITERKRAQKVLERDNEAIGRLVDERTAQLMEIQRQLENSRRLSDIGMLASTVAHELRNPLGVIKTATYNLSRKNKNVTLEKHLQTIEKKIEESNQIINNLLMYSRIKKPVCERVNVYELLLECLDTVNARFNGRSLTFLKKLDTLKGVYAVLDRYQIAEVVNNILINAVQAISSGGEGTVTLCACVNESMLNIKISDTGDGVDAEDLDKLFEPFFTRKSKGTGLGLTICKELVSLHEGSIEIESEKGAGTTVTVSLPLFPRSLDNPNE